MSLEHSPGREIIRLPAVSKMTGRSRVSIWRDVKAGRFPPPVVLGPNAIGWFRDEVEAHQDGSERQTYGAGA